MPKCRQDMVVQDTTIFDVATGTNGGSVYLLKPVFHKLLHGLIFLSDECPASLLVEHVVEGFIRFFLRVEVALLRFAVFQDNLRNPLFSLALLASEHRARAVFARPALAALLGLLLFVGFLFVGHGVT